MSRPESPLRIKGRYALFGAAGRGFLFIGRPESYASNPSRLLVTKCFGEENADVRFFNGLLVIYELKAMDRLTRKAFC